MGDTIVNTARGAANILANRVIVDMSSDIALLRPRVSPLTVLTKKLNTKACHNYRFEWMEDDMMARWCAINNVAGYASGITAIAVHAGEGGLIAAGDLLKVVRTAEIIKVSAVATDALTVVRGYGETAAAALVDDDKLLVVGNANMQGGVSPAEKYNQPSAVYNYTQIFKTPFSATNTLEKMDLYGGSELSRLQSKKGIEHAMSLEYAMLFGERKLDTSGAQPVTTTAGVLKFLAGTTNVASTAANGTDAAVQAALNTWFENLFTYGSENKVWFCSPGIFSRINTIAVGKLQLVQSDKDSTFGLDVTTWQTPHGKLNMVMHPLLTQGYYNYSFALDMENLAYRPLSGRDTKLMTNIQANDEDGRRDMYITEAGLELKLPKSHGIFQLT